MQSRVRHKGWRCRYNQLGSKLRTIAIGLKVLCSKLWQKCNGHKYFAIDGNICLAPKLAPTNIAPATG